MELKPHQIRAVEQTEAAIARGERKIVITAPTGGGKSLIAGTLLKNRIERCAPAIIYTNKRLLTTQNADVLEGMGLDFGMRAAGHGTDLENLLQVASVQTEHSRVYRANSRDLHNASLVIVEECFSGETLVSTPRGPVRIDNVRPGDTVHCATGIGVVEAVSVRLFHLSLYRLEFSNGISIECTSTHPVFTGAGWQAACAMEVGSFALGIEDVCWLWKDVRTAPVGKKRPNKRHRRKPLDRTDDLLSILLEEGEESNERAGQYRQDEEATAGDQAQAYQARRERAIAALAQPCLAARAGEWVGVGVLHPDKDAARKRVSDRVQGGHRKPGVKDRHRNRRAGPRVQILARQGPEENGLALEIRLVNKASVERESPVPVFNLRVNGHPSYFANGLLVHNCHVQLGDTNRAIFQKHHDDGAAIVGITATPLDMGDFYDKLIVAGTNSELRECGMLVPAIHYGADEPDLKALKVKDKEGADFSKTEQRKAIMTPTIFARVGQWFDKLNPERKPTILFGPGVNESLWFAERFQEKGINAAHIDGEDIWIKGEMHKSTPEVRQQLADGSKSGDIVVVCNRYVLREGVNWPWVQHGILAYVVGSLQTYLQIGGRFLRAYPGKTHATIQDHGGAWWRHGSLNSDREWNLNYTNSMIAGIRADRMRKKVEKEPWRCRCGRIRNGTSCECGATMPPKKSRPVVMADGQLREMTGDCFRPRRICTKPDGERLWEKMYFRSRTAKGTRTFRAAMALFSHENNYAWPDPNWKYMPVHELDFYRLCSEVPRERLR